VVDLPPFDAWTVVGDEPEPWGSHATEAAALAALDGRGGGVTLGMTFLRWHAETSERARELLRPALKAHGFHGAPRPAEDVPMGMIERRHRGAA